MENTFQCIRAKFQKRKKTKLRRVVENLNAALEQKENYQIHDHYFSDYF